MDVREIRRWSTLNNLTLFLGVPGRPGQPEPVDYDRDFIKLKWEPPRSNGGSPIIGYDIERKDKKSNRWVKVNKNPVPVSQ